MGEIIGKGALALLPIIWLIVALTGLKMAGHKACVGALIITIVESLFIWKMPVVDCGTSALEGFASALWPIILVIIAQPIAKVALKFGPAEYAVLMLFSLTIIASAAGKSLTKGLLGGCIGLFFGCVGMDASYTIPRLTFGSLKLSSGIDLVVMLIGALALSEVLKQVETVALGQTSAQLPEPSCKDDTRFLKSDFKLCLPHWLRSSAPSAPCRAWGPPWPATSAMMWVIRRPSTPSSSERAPSRAWRRQRRPTTPSAAPT